MTPASHDTSNALHARVQAFMLGPDTCGDSFDTLACDIARFQAARSTGLDRLLRARRIAPEDLRSAELIPAVPTDVFKLRRVACHEPVHDEVVFRTSGTTIGARGQHPMRTTATYRTGARLWGKTMLFPDAARPRFVVLAPDYRTTPESSLGFMLQDFALSTGTPPTFAVIDGQLSVDQVESAVREATIARVPVIVAGAAFAFVHWLEAIGGRKIQLPPGSRAMQTGGFKGRVAEVDGEQLRRSIASSLGIGEAFVIGEYGMTELGSQAYEATLRSALQLRPPHGPPGLYFAPPWMRVSALDPATLAPVAMGDAGIARIVDLANVDSAVAIQTADRIRQTQHGFELLGRTPGAPPRGCSIGIDEILGTGADR